MTDPRDPLARLIDHTLLRADATAEEIDRLCDEARALGFAAVCVNGAYAARCAERLRGTTVAVCVVVGFPLGAQRSDVKAYEARRALEDGAREVDMVMNLGELKSGHHDLVGADVRAVVDAAGAGTIVKVILETGLLDRGGIVSAAQIARAAGAAFVKTSTGFGPRGASVDDVRLLREAVGAEMGVKASGGIRTRAQAEAMVAAGANRIGTSAGVRIVTGEPRAATGG
jgi:deoxyribose-phosphate aldolase